MKDSNKNRFTTEETREKIVFTFPSPGFSHPITPVFMITDILLLFCLSLIFYGLYYAPIAYKLIILAFSTPFLGLGVIVNIILVRQFIIKSSIEVDDEKIITFSKFIKEKIKTFKTKDIINIKNKQSNNQPDNMYPKVIIVTKDKEYSIGSFTAVLNNEEATWIANKINQYLEKNIIT